MGLLDELFSYIDSKKRVLGSNLSDIANNPAQAIQTLLTGAGEDVRSGLLSFGQDAQAAVRGDTDAAARATAGLLSNMPAMAGVTSGKPLFDFANPGGGSRVAKIGNTEITYGVGKNGVVDVILVKTPKQYRGEGSARNAMQSMADQADASGLRLALDAEPMDKGVTQSGLESFYKSLGFRKNTGKKADFDTMRGWVRDPSED